MKHLDLINEFRELIARLKNEVEAASAMQLYDTHKIAEHVVCGVLREVYPLPNLRNLNIDEANFPGIDLADDVARVAVQVTATADLTKIKNTLRTFFKYKLQDRYQQLYIYILTVKQSSYSQQSIDEDKNNDFSFSVDTHIIDFRDISSRAANISPSQLQAAVNILKAYLRGIPTGLSDEDIDPPKTPSESVVVNCVNIDFPKRIYIAQVNSHLIDDYKKLKSRNLRSVIREFCLDTMRRIPSGYITHGGNLITFYDLCSKNNPYQYLIDDGTVEEFSTQEFWGIDDDHERAFKALLRFSIQHRLYSENVIWNNDEKIFVFLPHDFESDMRAEAWQGERHSTRKVFERKRQKNDKNKILMQKHLAFSVDFHRINSLWLMLITPTWFFSYGQDFKKSGFSYANLSWIKRRENNRAVFTHFRFLVSWLNNLDKVDLFAETKNGGSFINFHDPITLNGTPFLDETLWEPLPDEAEIDDIPPIQRLFN